MSNAATCPAETRRSQAPTTRAEQEMGSAKAGFTFARATAPARTPIPTRAKVKRRCSARPRRPAEGKTRTRANARAAQTAAAETAPTRR